MLSKPPISSLFPTPLINSTKHEPLCKILYIKHGQGNFGGNKPTAGSRFSYVLYVSEDSFFQQLARAKSLRNPYHTDHSN